MVRFYFFPIVILLSAGCGSEDFTAVARDRAPLMTGFESYAAREEVLPKLPADRKAEVVEDSSLTENDGRPPYRVYTVRVSPYVHLEQPGKLLITFYNDRLLQTAYYPERFDDYLTALRKSGVALKFAQELITGHTVVWIGLDLDNQHYVGWADKRLREQQRRWLARYS